MDPLFGDIPERHPATEGQGKDKAAKERTVRKSGQRASSFATCVTLAAEEKSPDATAKNSSLAKVVNAFQKPCVFCQKNHTLTLFSNIKELPSKDRISFLKSKGLCFGCLTLGHLSKDCKKKMKCQTCSQSHPDILHVNKQDSVAPENTEENNTENKEISSAYVSLNQETCGYTGAGEEACVLAVVPVKIKYMWRQICGDILSWILGAQQRFALKTSNDNYTSKERAPKFFSTQWVKTKLVVRS